MIRVKQRYISSEYCKYIFSLLSVRAVFSKNGGWRTHSKSFINHILHFYKQLTLIWFTIISVSDFHVHDCTFSNATLPILSDTNHHYMYFFQVYALDSFKTIFYKGVSHQWYSYIFGFFQWHSKEVAESQ